MDNILGWSLEGLCALRARVPHRGTVAVAGHTTPGMRSCRRLTVTYASAPQGCPCCMFSYTQTIGKRNMWPHIADLSLDFAAWQTIVRCVAFYHSLLSERSFSMLQSK